MHLPRRTNTVIQAWTKGSLVNQYWNGKRHCDISGVGVLACDVINFRSFIGFFIIKKVFQDQ